MEKKVLLSVSDIAEILGVSKSKAYKIIKEGNENLQKMNKLTIAGKLPVEYFNDIFYSSKNNG